MSETTTQTQETTDTRLEDDMSTDAHVDTQGLANLARKLSEIYREVKAVEKTGENSYHGYSYVEEAQIVAKIRKELAERNIMLTSSTVDMRKSGKDGSLTTVEMQYTFIDGETGTQITRHWYGEGKDDQDKGAYKAYTGATKYFLLKTFLVPSGDDPEAFEDIYDDDGGESNQNGSTSDGQGQRQGQQGGQSQRGNAPAQQANQQTDPDDHRRWIFGSLKEVCESKEATKELASDVVGAMLSVESVDTFDDMPPERREKWARSIEEMSAEPRDGTPSERWLWAHKFPLSQQDHGDLPEHDDEAWKDASAQFFAVCEDLGEDVIEPMRRGIKQRHGVDSWKQLPVHVLHQWSDLLEAHDMEAEGGGSPRYEFATSLAPDDEQDEAA